MIEKLNINQALTDAQARQPEGYTTSLTPEELLEDKLNEVIDYLNEQSSPYAKGACDPKWPSGAINKKAGQK